MANSRYCLPMVFFNLGGEMLYVLDQRLKAQNILPDKASKVLCDIVSQMTEEKCLEEIFNPQFLPGKAAIRSLFDRLAHASIMRLNTSSMDKLYDLMTMAFKYQVMLSKAPEDLMLVTLNHLDTIRDMVNSSEPLVASINDIHRRLRGFYKDKTNGEFMYIRHTLLYFFQDMRKRVSILLRDKAQLSDGHFVMPVGGPVSCGADVPGTIRYMENGIVTKTSTFLPALPFTTGDDAGSLELFGDRVTNLGTNLYSVRRELDTSVESFANTSAFPPPDIGGDPSAVEEFNLLAHLVRSSKPPSADTFKLNLFNDDDEVTISSTSTSSHVVHIDAKKSDAHLQSLIKDFSNVNTDQQKDDILDLLDQASS